MAPLGWALVGALSIVVVLSAVRAIQAGPLDPPGPVGSTMGAFDDLLPSWGRTLDSTGGCDSERFDCVMSDAAVLDRETGLVWDRTPNSTSYLNYTQANDDCTYNAIGGRYGWRLPTITELWSLTDDSEDDNLPDGNPFVDAGGGIYWSTTTVVHEDDYVKTLAIYGGFIEELYKPRFMDDISNVWCVRGGIGLDDDPSAADQPAWSSNLPASPGGCSSARFECVMTNAEAVLDRETGLVWQRTPNTTHQSWIFAIRDCNNAGTGGRRGWRLPSIDELMSLIDPSKIGPAIALPTGHPFSLGPSGPVNGFFWSSSLGVTGGPEYRDVADFMPSSGSPGSTIPIETSSLSPRWWCVRGGDGHHPQ